MGASLGRIAQNVHSDAVFLDAGLDRSSSGSNGEFRIRPNTLPVGKEGCVIDVFTKDMP